MAQDGDTITYTYSDGTSVAEDVSNVDEVVVEYCDGPGGESFVTSGGSGGRVENATIDVSGHDSLYIWVGANVGSVDDEDPTTYGRYPEAALAVNGTSEISFSNTSGAKSYDEPFLVGAGAGADGSASAGSSGGDAGERGGNGGDGDGFGIDGLPGNGTPPPAGGDGADANTSQVGGDGDGAIDDQNRGLVSGGTTIKAGGSSPDTNGEVKLSFQSGLSPPDPPSNLTAEVQ